MNIFEGVDVGGPSFFRNVVNVTGDLTETGNLTITGTTTLNGGLAATGTITFAGTWDGWIGSNETWTYVSGTTFTVASDVTGKYQKGDKIKLTQTTAKYFYISATPTYSAPNTTITVTGGTDYTLANAAITGPFYSKVNNPQGHPGWFNWTPTYSASGSMTYTSVSTDIGVFKIDGNSCTISLRANGTTGGTASTQVKFTLPVNGSSTQMDGQLACVKIIDTAGVSGQIADTGSAGIVGVLRYDGANWALGATRYIMVVGTYRI